MNLLIRHTQVLTHGKLSDPQDIHVQHGRITRIGKDLQVADADAVIEGKQLVTTPGWVDLRAHANEPGHEERETLTAMLTAASMGGYAYVCTLPHTQPVADDKNLIEYLKTKSRLTATEIWPMAALTTGLKGENMAELTDLYHAGAVAFTDGNHAIDHAGLMLRALQYVSPFQGLIVSQPHEASLCAHGQMHEGPEAAKLGLKGIPGLAEEIAIQRDIDLLRYAGVGRLHFTKVSTTRGLEYIRKAKAEGLAITCDVAIANLSFTDAELSGFDTSFKVFPPLREETDRVALWQGLADGTIDAVVSDHTPWDVENKALEFDLAAFGMSTIHIAALALWQAKPTGISITLEKILTLLAENPYRVLQKPKPLIDTGTPAVLTVVDTATAWVPAERPSVAGYANSPWKHKTVEWQTKAVVNGTKWWSDAR